MGSPDLIIRGRRVLADGQLAPRAVHVAGGRIAAIAGYDERPEGCPTHDAGDAVVMPGVVDTHVHVNEPGRTEWEGYASATRAAAAGGITTLVDMPLNSVPPTTTAAGFAAKRAAAEGQCMIDVGFWGGVIPGNVDELEPLCEGGVRGFKCFLVPSGVDEFPHVTEAELRPAMQRLAALDAPLLFHAELPGPIEQAERAQASLSADERRRYATYLASRPRAAEDRAIELVVRLARDTGARCHIVHHASADSLATLARARDEGLSVTAETCPHYLHFSAEEIPDGATEFKCAPPIREAENRERLWQGLADGVLDQIVSDHSPCAPQLKGLEAGDFAAAWGGISGLQLGLSVAWTGARARDRSLVELARWLCEAPARLAGLSAHKGRIAVGCDADLVIWDPDEAFTVDPQRMHHKHPITPYAGARLYGAVRATYVRGTRVFADGVHASASAGTFLLSR